jgi:enoyl-CoA hydratase/carnithine racemase
VLLPQSYWVEGRAAQSRLGDDVILERADGIAVVTLNRPNALNALSHGVMHALDGVLDALAADATLRAVIVTGAGRAFSAGGDLLEFHEKLHDSPRQLIETLAFNQRVFAKLEALPVPVIGAVNGTAVAGGLELLLCCDVLIAAEDAKMGDGHAKYAVVPAGGATVRLFRKISPNRAMQLFFSAALVSARELCDWGLINEVVPAPQLLARAKEVASQFCRQSPEVLAHIKDLARAYLGAAPNDGFQAELAAFAKHIGGKDLAEGLAAFRDKRRPRY